MLLIEAKFQIILPKSDYWLMLNIRLVFGVFLVVYFASIEKVVLSRDAEPSKILHVIFVCVIHRILVQMALVGESTD